MTTSGLYRSGLNWYLNEQVNTGNDMTRINQLTVLGSRDLRGSRTLHCESDGKGNPRGCRHWKGCNGLRGRNLIFQYNSEVTVTLDHVPTPETKFSMSSVLVGGFAQAEADDIFGKNKWWFSNQSV